MPGHSKAMLVAYPELASAPGPYVLGCDRLVDIATIDPTREETYQFISRLLGEMAHIVPRPVLSHRGRRGERSPMVAERRHSSLYEGAWL